jgi:glycosyltransferase involved in cell wall biosynthesis
LHVLMTTDAVGGVWVYATSLARMFCHQGHRVTLVTLGPAPAPHQVDSLRGIVGLNLRTTDLALEWMDPDGRDLPRALEQLRRIGRRVRPDVIHLNGFREALADWMAPVLVVAHSCVASWWRACRPHEPLEAEWRRYAANVAAGLAAADLWVAPTVAHRDITQDLYRPPRPDMVIWNGLDDMPTLAQKEPFILAAGRLWDEAKNIAVLDSAARELDWPIRAVGPLQPPQDGNGTSLTSGVETLGELPRGALRALMDRAAIFAAPAVYEPFGLTVLEAAAAGCALVLADIPSFRELWAGAARFVDPRDVDGWRDALLDLSCNKTSRETLQQGARRRAARYALRVTAREYCAAYTSLVESIPSPARTPFRQSAEAYP